MFYGSFMKQPKNRTQKLADGILHVDIKAR